MKNLQVYRSLAFLCVQRLMNAICEPESSKSPIESLEAIENWLLNYEIRDWAIEGVRFKVVQTESALLIYWAECGVRNPRSITIF